MNKWLGSGKVSGDPTIRYNEDKVSFVAFTLMTKRNRKIREGDQAVDFVDCICVGQLATLAEQYLRKGKKIEVTGPLQSGHYTDKNGNKVYTKTVFVETLEFAETKAEEEARAKAENGNGAPQPAPDDGFMDIPDGIQGELPFN